MICAIDIGAEAETVLELQRAAYRIEANLIGSDLIPPLQENLSALRECGETFHGWLGGHALTGIVSHIRDRETLDIHRLAVHPRFFRRGIARRLLQHVIALEPLPARYFVQTGRLNTPAIRLYESFGFVGFEVCEVAPRLFVQLFQRHQWRTGSPGRED